MATTLSRGSRRSGWEGRKVLLLALILTGAALASPFGAAGGLQVPRAAAEAAGGQGADSLIEKVQSSGSIRVIVKLDVAFVPEGRLIAPLGAVSQRVMITQAQDRVLKRLEAFQSRPARRFRHVPYFAIQVNAEALADLLANPQVIDIIEDVPVGADLAESVPLVGADDVWARGFTGDGQTIAILDTGVDGSHPFLQGKIEREACFSTTNSAAGARSVCPNGQDEQIGVGAGAPCSVGGCYHGTHVAGIAAGRGNTFSGVAPEASLIAVQVFSRFSGGICSQYGIASPCALSYTSDQMAALDWVYDQRSSFAIAAVNMSLGGGRFTAACDSDTRKPGIDNLLSVGIVTTIASGNTSYADALGAPACVSSAISVGATTKGDVVAGFSNVSGLLDLFAPGVSINSSVPGGGFTILNGTSMAAPHVAGAWALILSADPGASAAQVLSALQSTGLSIIDQRAGGGVSKPRIQIEAALSLLVPTATATATSTATLTLSPTSTSTATATSTPTATPTDTPIATSTPTPSATPTSTDTPTPTTTPSLSTATTTPSTPDAPQREDLNLDGRVNVLDVQLCVNVFLGAVTDPGLVARADVSGDGAVNVLDVQRIVNIFLAG